MLVRGGTSEVPIRIFSSVEALDEPSRAPLRDELEDDEDASDSGRSDPPASEHERLQRGGRDHEREGHEARAVRQREPQNATKRSGELHCELGVVRIVDAFTALNGPQDLRPSTAVDAVERSPERNEILGESYRCATTSISMRTPEGSPPTWTVARAGGVAPM